MEADDLADQLLAPGEVAACYLWNLIDACGTQGARQNVVVEEDVWLGTNVTLLSGVKVGRGATVGAGAVVRSNVPPYSIVMGNPAKVIGFSLRPEEIIEHEQLLYPEEERLPLDKLEKNYNKYFMNRLMEIRKFTSI